MKELKFITHIKELKATLEPMSHKEKLEHLWTYYKWVLVVLLCVIMLTSVVMASCEGRRVNVIVGGIAVNVDISDAGEEYLRDGFKAHVGSESPRDRVSLSFTNLYSAETNVSEDNYYAMQSIMAIIAGKDLDYLITDEEAYLVLLNKEIFMDLRKVFTEAELEYLGDMVVTYQESVGSEKIPIALNIQNTAFIQENVTTDEVVYFTFIANSERIQQTKNLLQWLLDWPAVK